MKLLVLSSTWQWKNLTIDALMESGIVASQVVTARQTSCAAAVSPSVVTNVGAGVFTRLVAESTYQSVITTDFTSWALSISTSLASVSCTDVASITSESRLALALVWTDASTVTEADVLVVSWLRETDWN